SQVTRDTSSYVDLSLAGDGRTIATVEAQTHNSLHVMPEGAGSAQAREIPSEGFPNYDVVWTRDGQLLTSVMRGGVALINPATASKTLLFSQFHVAGFAPSCPDGRILFQAVPDNKIEGH